jgi:hypothetical protein
VKLVFCCQLGNLRAWFRNASATFAFNPASSRRRVFLLIRLLLDAILKQT